jgi:hypothetical protein
VILAAGRELICRNHILPGNGDSFAVTRESGFSETLYLDVGARRLRIRGIDTKAAIFIGIVDKPSLVIDRNGLNLSAPGEELNSRTFSTIARSPDTRIRYSQR